MIRVLALAAALLLPGSARAAPKASYTHYLKALLLANQGSYAEALGEYEAALALDPQSAFMYEQAAELALETGKTQRALEFAARFVELSPESPEAHFLMGNVHWARGDWESAKASFERTLELRPDYEEALFTLGNLLSAQSPERAKDYLSEYLRKNPDNASEAEYQIALIAQRAGRLEEAVAHLVSSVEKDPENMQARFSLAQIYEVRRDTDAALAAYLAILDRDSRNVALLNHVGEMLFLRDDADGARELFGRAKALMPSNSATCLWLALLAEHQQDYAGAVAQIKDSASLQGDASLNLRLSYYLTQDNRLKEAVEVLEAAHAKWPKNEELGYFLALGYDDLKQTAKAVRLMNEVLALRPEHRDARFQLGAMYEKEGDILNAELQFREILRSHPNDATALNYLGYSLADRSLKLPEAEALIRKAVELNPQSGAYVDSLGWVFFRQGRNEEALRELKRAVSLLPDDDAVWEHLGDVYRVSKDTGAAWDAFKTAQSIEPAKPEFAQKLAMLESQFSAEELGARYQEFFAGRRGALSSFGGPCLIEGKVAGKSFRFSGILHYKAPRDLSVDVLGPLFVPMFRAAFKGESAFEMDPLALDGVSQDFVRENFFRGLKLVRDYLDGSFFRGRPAQFASKWRGREIATPDGILILDKTQTAVSAVELGGGKGYRLDLSEHRNIGGRRVPTKLELSGRGFFLQFRLPAPSAAFD